MFRLRSGRLRGKTSGADRSQAVHKFEAIDLVKEISQTCGRSATVRPKRTLDRRMVTAAQPVCSAWFSTTGERNGNDATHWNRSAPELLYRVHSAGERKELPDGMETGTAVEVHLEAAAERRSRRRGDRQHAAVSRCRGAARQARGGRQFEPVQNHHSLDEEDRSQRRPQSGAVPRQGSAAGGAHEG